MPALPALAIGVTIAATAASLAAAAQQTRAQQASADYNAKLAGYNATIQQQQGDQDAADILRQGELNTGKARAAAAASGLGDSGSVQDVTYANLVGNEQDALAAQYRGKIGAYNANNQSALDSMQASNAGAAGGISDASILLSGASNTYKAYNTVYPGVNTSPIFGQTTTANSPGF